MPAASILVKPTSANCNMDCQYCFYKCLSRHRKDCKNGLMTEETLEELIKQAISYAEHSLTFAFQGGEPTLAGIEFYKKAIKLQEKYNKKGLHIENTIQTNGLLINEKWAKFFAQHHFLVGVSIDGPRKIHDRYRKDIDGQDTFKRIMQSISILEKYHVDYNIVAVITNEITKNPDFIYKFWKRNNYPYVQFIPCMDEKRRQNETINEEEYAVNPEQYGRFLCRIFDLWYKDFCEGFIMDIRMFSNLAQMAAGYPAEECGMNGCCNCYFVVESDGSVYPCDFYCMDSWKLGTVEDGFVQMKASKKVEIFENESKDIHVKCAKCPYFSLCRGGCRRWRESASDGRLGLHQLCKAYQIFFEHTEERIKQLGLYILRKNLT